MKQLSENDEFVPRDLGLCETWGFVIEAANGQSVLEIKVKGAWREARRFDESGIFVDRLRRDVEYRFSAIAADSISVI